MTTFDGLYIDAVVVKGTSKTFSVSIQQRTENEQGFEPFDLSNYSVKFSVMGSPVADGAVLLEKIITTNTDIDEEGNIDNPTEGQFSFTITTADTNTLGLGKFPIMLEILDAASLTHEFTLTEGGYKGEFNALQIVEI